MLIKVINDRHTEWWIDAKAVEQLKYIKSDHKLYIRLFGRDTQYEVLNVSWEEMERISKEINDEKAMTEERRRF